MAGAGAADLEELGLGMDKPQGDKFSKSACFLLNFAEQKQMPYPMLGMLGVAVHHGGGRRNAETVRRSNHLDPLPHFQFIGTQRSAHVIVENFSRCSGNTV